MKIQELERITGLERPSIRFYEKEGLLNPRRLENGYRDYSEEDAELLKKIKLLRRLGMSVEKIRNLQQGSEDLSQAITLLTAHHSSQIEDHKRCRAVCEAMRADGAAFNTLDAEHYLKLLREIRVNEKAIGRTDFQEKVQKEIHPWRRFFARWLDYNLWTTIITFVYIAVLRIRPLPGDFLSALIAIGGIILFIPAEALMLWKLGTTPGKFAFGIRLESIQGGNLTWEEALSRSRNVFVLGNGCCIPLLEPVMKAVRYCQYTGRIFRNCILEGPREMDWDEDTEIIYRDVNFKRGALVVLMLALVIFIGMISVFDGMRPKYRGNNLTVQEFSENYNAYLHVFRQDHRPYEKLKADGTWKPIPPNTAIAEFNDTRSDHRMEFIYQLEGETIRSISIEHDWNDVSYLHPLVGEPLDLVSSILLAQEGCGVQELAELTDLYWKYSESKTATFDYKNLTIEWTIISDLPMEGITLFNQSGETATAQLLFRITIH